VKTQRLANEHLTTDLGASTADVHVDHSMCSLSGRSDINGAQIRLRPNAVRTNVGYTVAAI